MKPGDIVMARSIEVYQSIGKGALVKQQSQVGKAIVFLALGAVASDAEVRGCSERALRKLGYIPATDATALRAALAAINRGAASPVHSHYESAQ